MVFGSLGKSRDAKNFYRDRVPIGVSRLNGDRFGLCRMSADDRHVGVVAAVAVNASDIDY